VEGTIPRGYLPLIAGGPLTLESAKDLVNPIEVSATTLKQGAKLYATFCQVCHGAGGQGDGPVTKRGVPPPPPYTYESLSAYTGGQLFQIMTEGKGNMPPYKGQVRAEDRWKVVHYLQSMRMSPLAGAQPFRVTS
jgi:mono/diheme cytochrome c family protein